MSRSCPTCTEDVKDDGRCTNTKCTGYSFKVLDEITEREIEGIMVPHGHELCTECLGAGWEMKCYGDMPIEVNCENCYGEGTIEDPDE